MIKVKQNDKILNFLYEDNDEISKKLIECYQELMFNKNKNIKLFYQILDEYTNKNGFYKYLQQNFPDEDLYELNDQIIKKVISIYKRYQIDKLKVINNARWL